jgi:hypothetical protein
MVTAQATQPLQRCCLTTTQTGFAPNNSSKFIESCDIASFLRGDLVGLEVGLGMGDEVKGIWE